jgi:hypothetical protein
MVVIGLVVLPQAGVSSDDPGKTSKAASGVGAAMISGRVTDEAGAPLADVRLSVAAVVDPETRTVNARAQSKEPVAKSNARGDYRLEVSVITKRTIILIDGVKPDGRGALILDPGKDSDCLKGGQVAEGYTFWKVGLTRVGSVGEFVDHVLAETAGQNADEYSVRVVYNCSTVDGDLSVTNQLKFTKHDRKQLQVLSEQLAPDEP